MSVLKVPWENLTPVALVLLVYHSFGAGAGLTGDGVAGAYHTHC